MDADTRNDDDIFDDDMMITLTMGSLDLTMVVGAGLTPTCLELELELLRLYSQERRQERYMVCFLWKLSSGLISG